MCNRNPLGVLLIFAKKGGCSFAILHRHHRCQPNNLRYGAFEMTSTLVLEE